jgi:hypothetical protein
METWINEQTGESFQTRENDEIKIVNPQTLKQAIKGRIYHFQNKKYYDDAMQFNIIQKEHFGNFVFLIYENMDKLKEILEPAEITRYMYLGTYCNNYGILTHDNNAPLNKKALFICLNLGEKEFNKFIKKLKTNNLLTENDKKFIINSDFFYKGQFEKYYQLNGKLISKQYFRMYITAVRKIFDTATSRQHKSLSIIFRIITYLHPKYNIICENPEETIIENIIPITIAELPKCLNLKDSKELSRTIKSMTLDGKPVFGTFEAVKNGKSVKRIYLNPAILYKGTCPVETQVLIDMFKM